MRLRLVHENVSEGPFNDNIEAYFNDVKREYILNPMGEAEEKLDFLPENRDVFIKNNLKLIINTAKKYRGFGIDFEDLIQAGNMGLLAAWDVFDKDRASLRSKILEVIENDSREDDECWNYDECEEIIRNAFSYSKLLNNTLAKIPKEGFANRELFKEWVTANIKKATFTSVGFLCARAEISNFVSKYINIIKVPKSVLEDPAKKSTVFINIDSVNPYTDDNYYDQALEPLAQDSLLVEETKFERSQAKTTLQDSVALLLGVLTVDERRLIKKMYGIGQPYTMRISELSENEGISIPKVKEIINSAHEKLRKAINKKNEQRFKDLVF